MGKRYEWGKGGEGKEKGGSGRGERMEGGQAWPGPSLQFLDPPLAALSIAAVGRLD